MMLQDLSTVQSSTLVLSFSCSQGGERERAVMMPACLPALYVNV